MQAVLKQNGLKVTEQRCRLLEFLHHETEEHLTVEQIYQGLHSQGEPIGLNAVYRMLASFEQVGLVARRQFESDKAVYELANKPRHDHFVCISCGKLTEFNDALIDLRLGLVAERNGMSVDHHNLSIYGHCTDCRNKEK